MNIFSLQNSNCKLLETVYKNEKISTINSINDSEEFNKPLIDFYIKTAYNAASAGQFKNSFVDSSITDPQYCALRTCIQQGARCLDFEIYSVDDEPVISTSLINSVNIKQTFNFLKFSEATTHRIDPIDRDRRAPRRPPSWLRGHATRRSRARAPPAPPTPRPGD